MSRVQLDEEAIFGVAIRIDSSDCRSDYLQQVCGNDVALMERVKSLLAIHEKDKSFLADPPIDFPATEAVHQITETAGDTIGPYKMLQKIGEGGFGIVYMAEQTEPIRRKVALKIIKPGMDTKEVVARFEAERQALALMDHPSIAKVLDGGATESGRPYFVMELVKGIPLTQFCDENNLDVRRRLKLFCTVCKAIQHAHHKGVIHRDIKPSNVLVTLHDGEPVPKVIDFGVSKAISQQLTERTMFTAYGQMIGTPQYMSPEQAEMSGLDVDTRSDVYSLGVLLYELLTGSTPLDPSVLKQTAYAELQRMIREDEPPRPSVWLSSLGEQSTSVAARRDSEPKKLGAFIRGELDWIVMKSLEKNRDRRYETTNSMAADVENFLNGDQVKACPPSLTYQCQKYVKRHKAMLFTAGSIAAVLLVATIVSSVAAIQALQNLARAEAAEREAKAELAMRLAADERFNRAKGEQAIQNALLDALSGHYDQVESHLRDAAVYKVDPGRISLLRGWAAIEAEDLVKAREHLESAVAQMPESMAAKVLLSDVLMQAADWERWTRLGEQLKEMTPQTPDDYLFAGRRFAFTKPVQAVEWLEDLMTEHKSPVVYYMLARAYHYKSVETRDPDDLERAIELASVARTILPNDISAAKRYVTTHLTAADVHRFAGESRLEEYHLKAAKKAAGEMLEQSPESSLAHQANARVAMAENELEQAIRHAREADRYATKVMQHSDLVDLLALAGRYDEELEAFDELSLRIGYSSFDVWRSYPIVEVHGVQPAVEAYNEWFKSATDRAKSANVRAVFQLFCLLGDPAEARRRCEECLEKVEVSEARSPFTFTQAKRQFVTGKVNEEEFLAAANNRFDRIAAYEMLGFLRLGEGDRAAAIREFEQAEREGSPSWGSLTLNEGKIAAIYLNKLRRDPTWPSWIAKNDTANGQ